MDQIVTGDPMVWLQAKGSAEKRMKAWSAHFPRTQAINTAVSDDGFRVRSVAGHGLYIVQT